MGNGLNKLNLKMFSPFRMRSQHAISSLFNSFSHRAFSAPVARAGMNDLYFKRIADGELNKDDN